MNNTRLINYSIRYIRFVFITFLLLTKHIKPITRAQKTQNYFKYNIVIFVHISIFSESVKIFHLPLTHKAVIQHNIVKL